MTGRENIYLNGAIMGMTKAEISRKLDEIVDFSGCERYIDTPVKRYSSGMTVRLGFAIAAHLEPDILVVDEVLAVGDAEFQKKAIGKMQDISHGGGRTVLFVSHNMDSMLNLCNNGILMENGRIKFCGDIKSTVSEYISGGDTHVMFKQSEDDAKGDLYISSMKFTGTDEQQRGLFSYSDDITFSFSLKKKSGRLIDKKTVVSVQIMTVNHTRICNEEIKVGDIEGERTFYLSYKNSVFLPNKYLVYIAVHIPNVKFYDRQDTCIFTIYDNGTEFLKYNGTDNGFIMFHPDIIEK